MKPSFEAAGEWRDEFLGDRRAWFFAVLELFRPRAKRLDDFVTLSRFFFVDVDALAYDAAAVEKHLRTADMDEHLAAVDAAFAALDTFDPIAIEAALRSVADARGVKAASLIHAVRVAMTGKTVSPGLFEVLSLLGRARVHDRLVEARRVGATSAS